MMPLQSDQKKKFTMNDAKQVPLIWDFFKLFAAIFIAVAIAWVIFQHIPVLKYVGRHDFLMCFFMTQLTAFLAGLWGYQAIRSSRKVTKNDEWIRDGLFIHKLTWVILLILPLLWVVFAVLFLLPIFFVQMTVFFLFIFSLFLGSFLFPVLIVLTTILAYHIRGRFLLHLFTVYCLFTAHLLFWYLVLVTPVPA
jgi:hypothetical protein